MTTSTLIGYKAASDLAGKLSSFAIVVLAARWLTRPEFGLFSLAVTLGWMLSVASDFGLQLLVAREVARRPGDARTMFLRARRVRLMLTAVAAAIASPVAVGLGGEAALPFFLLVLAQLLSALVEFVNHLYRGLSRSDVESSLNLAQRLTTLAAAVSLLAWHPSLLSLALALVGPAAITLAVSTAVARRLCGTQSAHERGAGNEPGISSRLWRDAAPIGAGIVLSALYFRIDVFLVERWNGLEAVALYNAVFRLVEALRLFPSAVLAVVFPMLCRARTLRPLGFVAGGLLAFGVAVALAVYWPAAWLVRTFYGDAYLAAAPAFRVLIMAIPLFFLNYALTHQLVGWDAQTRYARITALALAANVVTNAILLPRVGIVGAAWATVLTEVVVTAGCVISLATVQPRRPSIRIAAPALS